MPTIRRPDAPAALAGAAGRQPEEPGGSMQPTSTVADGASVAVPSVNSISALRVPAETTPTWELEMLVSGAVLFGLFQLPPVLDHAFAALAPGLEGGGAQALRLAYVLGKAMLYMLTGAFVVHLAARAYWVALVGLDSVFPAGIRWERLGGGSITREVFRERTPPLPRSIERIDNFCSVLFAGGFLAVFTAAFGLALLLVGVALAPVVARLPGGRWLAHRLPLAIIVLLFTLAWLPRILERRAGTVEPGSALDRAVRRSALASYYVRVFPLHGSILATLSTNSRRWPIAGGLVVALVGSMLVVVLQLNRNDIITVAGRSVPAGQAAAAVDFRYYADQRSGLAEYAAVPYIQSDIVSEPYVRLVLPYVASRDDGVLARCPAAAGPSRGPGSDPEDAAALAALRCLAAAHPVSLDGEPQPGPDFRFFRDPRTGLPGLLAYIPVGRLAAGRHLLRVVSPPRTDAEESAPAPVTYAIPFWR
jgi:hypothetical protein